MKKLFLAGRKTKKSKKASNGIPQVTSLIRKILALAFQEKLVPTLPTPERLKTLKQRARCLRHPRPTVQVVMEFQKKTGTARIHFRSNSVSQVCSPH
jgi:hypothetical protein